LEITDVSEFSRAYGVFFQFFDVVNLQIYFVSSSLYYQIISLHLFDILCENCK